MIMLKDYTKRRNELLPLLPQLFDVLAENMREIAPTGNSLEDDYAIWTQAMLNELEKPEKHWVLAFVEEQLAGYVLYRIVGDILHLDEIQVAKPQQGDRKIFPGLIGKMFYDANKAEVTAFYSYANKRNKKSQGILQAMGLSVISETTWSFQYYGSFTAAHAWFRNKYSTCGK